MDNQAYLDQIAVKTKKSLSDSPIFTPLIIKLLVASVITLITIIVVGSIISGANAKTTQSYERLYLRVSQMCGNRGPYQTYERNINSSTLSAHANRLETSLINTNKDLDSTLTRLGLKKDAITKTVQNEETTAFNNYMSQLQRASISGQMDAYYSSQTANQIMQIISIERQILSKTNDDTLKSILNSSIGDLESLYENFRDFNDTL